MRNFDPLFYLRRDARSTNCQLETTLASAAAFDIAYDAVLRLLHTAALEGKCTVVGGIRIEHHGSSLAPMFAPLVFSIYNPGHSAPAADLIPWLTLSRREEVDSR